MLIRVLSVVVACLQVGLLALSPATTLAQTLASAGISGFSPGTGGAGGAMVIVGHGFTGATAVSVNSVAVDQFTVVNDSTINATRAAASSSGLVRVATPGGLLVSAGAFTVVQPKLAKVLMYGDSNTGGYLTSDPWNPYQRIGGSTAPLGVAQTILDTLDWQFANEGYSGRTAEFGTTAWPINTLRAHYLGLGTSYQQVIVVVLLQVNDFGHSARSSIEVEAYLRSILAQLRAPQVKIVLATQPAAIWSVGQGAAAISDAEIQARINQVNAWTRDSAVALGAHSVLDFATDYRFTNPRNTTIYQPDQIHFKDAGARGLGELLAAHVQAVATNQTPPHITYVVPPAAAVVRSEAFTLKPNPAQSVVYFSAPEPVATTPLRLYDARGRLVRQYDAPRYADGMPLSLDGLPPGLYVLCQGSQQVKLMVN
jgi:lysophospholipase L1-like esterase